MNYYRPTFYRYLKACAEIEKCMTLIYEHFAQQESSDERLQSIWQLLAEEERQHVAQVELLYSTARKLRMNEKRFDCDQVFELAKKAEHCLNKAFTMAYDPVAAIRLAVSLETWTHELHAQQRRSFDQDRFQFLFHTLASDDLQHIGQLHTIHNELSKDSESLQSGSLQSGSFENVISF